MAQEAAGVSPDTIGYIEAHGTGTPLGDPIELAALTEAFSAKTTAKQFCAIGTAKTNVGHLDVAAGVTGLINATIFCDMACCLPPCIFIRPIRNSTFGIAHFHKYQTERVEVGSEAEASRRQCILALAVQTHM